MFFGEEVSAVDGAPIDVVCELAPHRERPRQTGVPLTVTKRGALVFARTQR